MINYIFQKYILYNVLNDYNFAVFYNSFSFLLILKHIFIKVFCLLKFDNNFYKFINNFLLHCFEFLRER